MSIVVCTARVGCLCVSLNIWLLLASPSSSSAEALLMLLLLSACCWCRLQNVQTHTRALPGQTRSTFGTFAAATTAQQTQSACHLHSTSNALCTTKKQSISTRHFPLCRRRRQSRSFCHSLSLSQSNIIRTFRLSTFCRLFYLPRNCTRKKTRRTQLWEYCLFCHSIKHTNERFECVCACSNDENKKPTPATTTTTKKNIWWRVFHGRRAYSTRVSLSTSEKVIYTNTAVTN